MANINLKAYNAQGELVSVMDVSDPAKAQALLKSAEDSGFRVEMTSEVAPSEAFGTGLLQGVSAEWADEVLKRKDETKAAESSSPVAYGAGNIIGSLIPGALAAGAGGLAGAKLGAMAGAAGGPIGALLGGALGGGLATATATAGAAEEGKASAGEMAASGVMDTVLGLIPAGAIAGRAKKVYEKGRKLLGPVSQKQVAETTAREIAEKVSKAGAEVVQAKVDVEQLKEVADTAEAAYAAANKQVLKAGDVSREKLMELKKNRLMRDVEAANSKLALAEASKDMAGTAAAKARLKEALDAANSEYGAEYGNELALRAAPLIGAATTAVGAGRRAADRPLDRAAADRAFVDYMRNRPPEISAKK
jgi:hypothetical protein